MIESYCDESGINAGSPAWNVVGFLVSAAKTRLFHARTQLRERMIAEYATFPEDNYRKFKTALEAVVRSGWPANE